MKICFVGPANSTHIIKWCTWFHNQGHEIHIISYTVGKIENVKIHFVDIGVNTEGHDFEKLKYLLTGKKIKRIIQKINPDIINVHYATSYGAAMALSGINNYILSVWGADIYDFPKKSPLHQALLRFSLNKAACLFSTSRAMASEAKKYTDKKFIITPFGVDMDLFNPNKRTRTKNDSIFVVGTVKGLSDKYGIADILRAVAEIKKKNTIPIRLRIAGKGSQEKEYRKLACELGIDDITLWLGFVSQEEAAKEWANMEVAIIPSTLESESFGVSAVEAQACKTTVIISDIPGLMEATKPGITSIVVPRNDAKSIAKVIEQLYENPELRYKYAEAGREFVYKKYEINACFNYIQNKYSEYFNKQNEKRRR